MSKLKKIVITVIAVLLVLALAAWFFVPRILMAFGTGTITENISEPATYFTEYNVHNENTQTISNGHISIDIPADFAQESTDYENAAIYRNQAGNLSVLLSQAEDLHELNLMNEGTFQETVSSGDISVSMEQLRKGFEAMGNGMPDSAYNLYKCCHLTSKDDNSFWNLNQAAAFLTAGSLKEIAVSYGNTQIYETDEICGFISYNINDESIYKFQLEIYTADDLNTCTAVILSVEKPEDAYAIMNSARSCK